MNKIKKWVQEKVDFLVPQNQPNLLLKLLSEDQFSDLDPNTFGSIRLNSEKKEASFYIENGCNNRCSFCKTTFQRYPVKSVELDQIKKYLDILDEEEISTLYLKGTNICQLGLDKEHKYLLPEVIQYLEEKRHIQNVWLVGFAFKDAIQNQFQESLRESTKVIGLCGALESGSNGLLPMIDKGFTADEIILFIEEIRSLYYKSLYLSIVAGFPTETLEDVRKTLEVLKKLEPTRVDINYYANSPFVKSNQYEQLTPQQIKEHAKIYEKVLKHRNVSIKINESGYQYN